MARPGDSNFGKLQVDWRSWKDLQRAMRHAADTELPKRMGRANRSIGEIVKQLVDRKSDTAAVGMGRGATVRPSSSKREVKVRVGGAHRAGNVPREQWGQRMGRNPRQNAPPRPYIREIVEENRDDIEREWLDAVEAAMSGAFADTNL